MVSTAICRDLAAFGHPRFLVVGDLMLDRYTCGDAERISPEAPVIVLRGQSEDARPGGAANVASFLRGLDCAVSLAGVVGHDESGRMLSQILNGIGVNTSGVVAADGRLTTVKHRFVGRTSSKTPQQLPRVDHESRHPISPSDADRLRAAVAHAVPDCDALLLSDYAKGTLDSRIDAQLLLHENVGINAALEQGLPVDLERRAEFILCSDADMKYNVPISGLLDIFSVDQKIGAMSLQHSPEHPVHSEFRIRDEEWLLKPTERGCALIMRTERFQECRPLPVHQYRDFDWWVVRDSPNSLQQSGEFVAVRPGAATHLGWRAGDSTWQPDEIPETWNQQDRRFHEEVSEPTTLNREP